MKLGTLHVETKIYTDLDTGKKTIFGIITAAEDEIDLSGFDPKTTYQSKFSIDVNNEIASIQNIGRAITEQVERYLELREIKGVEMEGSLL